MFSLPDLGPGPRVLGSDAARFFLYKPPGLPVFPPHQNPEAPSLLAWWLQNGGTSEGWPPGFEGGLAHRLDNLTGGLMVAARSPAQLEILRAAFADKSLRKIYVFRSQGKLKTLPLLTDAIAHHPKKNDRMVVQGHPGTVHRGKWYPAWTQFRDLGNQWWEAEIRTGVMHQIRVHAAWAGLPLEGDPIYGDGKGTFSLWHIGIIAKDWRFIWVERIRATGHPL